MMHFNWFSFHWKLVAPHTHTQRTEYRYCQHFFNWFYGENRSLIKCSTFILTKWFQFFVSIDVYCLPRRSSSMFCDSKCNYFNCKWLECIFVTCTKTYFEWKHEINWTIQNRRTPLAHTYCECYDWQQSHSLCHLINLLLYLKIAGKRVIIHTHI